MGTNYGLFEAIESAEAGLIQHDTKTLWPISDLSLKRAPTLISSFPTTRYYGSKKRLLNWLFESLKDIPFQTVMDGFGGTASVSLLFKAMGKEVTFNDALISNAVSAKVLLANEISIENAEGDLFFHSIEPKKGFISETFSQKFYLDDENEWLDGAIQAIRSQPEDEQCVYMYSLFQACLQKRPFNLFHRANLNLRTNNVKQSFGNQTTWDTPFPILATRAFLELKEAVWRSSYQHTVLNPTDVSDIPEGFDLVYLDPPYISLKNGGDDYLRRYHFLEGLCEYEQWSELIDRSYQNLQYKGKRHISEWQDKKVFKKRLFNLIEKHQDSVVVLSYVDDAYPSQRQLLDFFRNTFKEVDIIEHDLSHALSRGKRNELLIIGKNN